MGNIREKKYAVMLDGIRLTEYVYDDVIQTKNTLYGVNHGMKCVSEIHAYSKENGKLLFKKDVEDYKFFEECMIIQVPNKSYYLYFDNTQRIIGPFYEVGIEKRLIKVKKIIENIPLYGAYNAKGNLVLPIKYSYIWGITDEIWEVYTKKGNSGLVDVDGDYILNPITGLIDYYFDDTFIIFYNRQKNAFGAINQYGGILLDCVYDDIKVDEQKGLAYIKEDNLYGIYKNERGVIFYPTFATLEAYDKIIEVIGRDANTYGYIPELNILLPRRYYVYEKNYLKYFDGYKWRKLKYNKK